MIGVAELCNKQTGTHFTKFDQDLDMILDKILATDLANYLRMLPEVNAWVSEGMSPNNLTHHYLTSCMIMTASDLLGQIKDS